MLYKTNKQQLQNDKSIGYNKQKRRKKIIENMTDGRKTNKKAVRKTSSAYITDRIKEIKAYDVRH